MQFKIIYNFLLIISSNKNKNKNTYVKYEFLESIATVFEIFSMNKMFLTKVC